MAQPGTPVLAAAGRAVCSLALLLLLVPWAAASGAVVEAVEVHLAVDGGVPPVVQARLQSTVETVAQRLLVGRPVDQLRPGLTQLRATLTTVVDRVVGGYTVAEARVEVGPTAVVAVRLRPAPPLVHEVEVLPHSDVDSAVAPLVLQPVQQAVASAVRAMLVGLPVQSLDWAGPLVAQEVRRAVEEALPGFSGAARVRAGRVARVDVDLLPRDGRVVRDIGVRFRSSSIPFLLLEQHAPAVLSMAGPIRGLPVAFVQGQRETLERLLAERLRAYPPAAEYRVVARPVLSVGETTYVTVVADSLLWLGRVEAQLNVGTRAPGPELRAHLGRLFGRLETFAEVGLLPNTLSARYDLGLRYAPDAVWDLGAAYTLNTGEVTGFVTYRVGPDVSVRLAYLLPAQQVEGSVRYRFTEFLSGEIVGRSGGEYWVRLISNL
ncbi:MAG: hypothetical protein QN152_02715 [Armatimonadota bacterium]|nr:hypothetical protein [Armatimonadota bacterium]MDR7426458.1 hypothetical protein [Armatimonadota bacterium]MDR7465126.1 hypothetical protein [Armatimonadota bacterium]MDR7470246.1 hypothetical protein [Armatimonadota bacterium]MDR7473403.1 hypothetical protein [Armatimonadota bacterium]